MTRRPVHVSDHALVRYLERVGGFDIERLRRTIAAHVRKQAPEGASALVIEGARLVLRDDGDRRVVTTVLEADWSINKAEDTPR